MYGKGRVFYSALCGHAPATWDDPRVQEMYLGAIKWALGLVDAGCNSQSDGDTCNGACEKMTLPLLIIRKSALWTAVSADCRSLLYLSMAFGCMLAAQSHVNAEDKRDDPERSSPLLLVVNQGDASLSKG